MHSSFARSALVLGLLSAVGPFAIDMYLPALPAITADLRTEPGVAQLSLTAFWAALAVCQIFYGPVSDMVGRRPPLYFGMVVYTVGAIGCALAPNVETLIALRFVQGIGACAGIAIPRAVIRDLHTGPDAARLMSLTMLVFSVVPMIAPMVGSLLSEFVTWRAIFGFIALLGVVGIVVVAAFLPETRPPESRRRMGIGSILRTYAGLLGSPRFVGVSMIGGLGLSSFFLYVTGSSFLFIDHFGLAPTTFSLIFASNAMAFIGAAQLNGFFGRRFGLERVVRTAIVAYAVLTAILFAVTLLGGESFIFIWGMLVVSFGCLGLVVPPSAVLALDDHGPIAGMASALLGTIQVLLGATVTGVVSLFATGSPVPMVAGIAACGFVAFVLSRLVLGRRPAL